MSLKVKFILSVVVWLFTLAGILIFWCVDWRLGVALALKSIADGIDNALTVAPALDRLAVRIADLLPKAKASKDDGAPHD